jgi:hypothetical protein
MRVRTTSAAVVAVATLTVSGGLVPATAAPSPPAGAPVSSAALVSRTAYSNPVSRGFADTFADPPVIRGKDGFWYSYLNPSNGEHELRARSSRDGRTWVKGGVWTLPAGARVRVGLIAHGGGRRNGTVRLLQGLPLSGLGWGR